MVRRTKSGYKVFSKEGKALTKAFKSKAAAIKKNKEIEYYKRKNSRGNS